MSRQNTPTTTPDRKSRKPTYLKGQKGYIKCQGFQATVGIYLGDLSLKIIEVTQNPSAVHLKHTDRSGQVYIVHKRKRHRSDKRLFSDGEYTYFAWLAKTNGKIKLRIGFKKIKKPCLGKPLKIC